jgi:hypothetical protein
LIKGTPELAIAGARLALKKTDRRCWGPNGDVRWVWQAGASRIVKRTVRVRAAVVGLLEDLPYICPVVVAIGSLIMIIIKLCKDWPQ